MAADLLEEATRDTAVTILINIFHGSLPATTASQVEGSSSSDSWPTSSSSVEPDEELSKRLGPFLRGWVFLAESYLL
jgi:hypothetical protein